MDLLTHLFSGKKAKGLVMEDAKRMALWEEHVTNYESRESLCRRFSFGNIDKALQDFTTTVDILQKIEALIPQELASIVDEEKNDEEILADLKRLRSVRELEELSETILSVKQKHSLLLKLFREINHVLKTELHLIRLIRKKPQDARDPLLKLFKLIFHHEDRLYRVFREKYFEKDTQLHAEIARIARAILLEEKVEEEMETDEEKFVREAVKQMGQEEPRRRYRRLAEDIFHALAEMAGAPMPRGEDLTKGIRRMEELMRKDDVMYKLVKRLRPRYDDTKIRGIVLAFRAAYNLCHFIDLESDFAT